MGHTVHRWKKCVMPQSSFTGSLDICKEDRGKRKSEIEGRKKNGDDDGWSRQTFLFLLRNNMKKKDGLNEVKMKEKATIEHIKRKGGDTEGKE